MRQTLDDFQHVVNEWALGKVNAEQLWNLVDHDDDRDPGLESGQHRPGNEIREKAQSQHGCEHQDHAHHQRQRRGGDHQFRGTAVRRGAPERGRYQNGKCRGRADAKRTRCAGKRVNHHRQERRVETDLHRQAGYRGIRKRFRNDDRRRGQSRDGVGPDPRFPVMTNPFGNRTAPGTRNGM
nr:hypothetical protein [Paraburkholderia gardini]